MPMDPAEQQAFLASTLAIGEAPTAAPETSTTSALPASGIAQPGQAQPGLGMDAPPVGTQKVESPYNETTTKTPTLAPQAVDVQRKLDATEAKYRQAEQMTVPIEKVQPYVAPGEFEAMKASGQTDVNYGQFQDLQARYKNQLEAKAEADFAKAEQQKAADSKKQLDQMMAAADERWRKVADMGKPENMMPSPSFATKIVQAIASGLSTWANIRMGHSGPSPVDQMLDAEANREFAARKDALSSEKEAAANLGQRAKDFRASMLEDEKLKEQRRADLYRAAGLQAAKMADAFPTQARELQMKAAEFEMKGLQIQRDLFVKELTRQNESKNVSEKSERVEALAGGSGKGGNAQPTQFQQTLALHGDTMQKSIDELRQLKPISNEALATAQDNESLLDAAAESNKTIGGAAKTIVLRKFGALPRNKGAGLSENDQLYLNALDGANEGFQRVLSGANIQEKERSRLSNQLMLQPEDPPSVVKWKLDKMEREKNNFLLLAGKAGEQITARNEAEKNKATPSNSLEPPAFKPAQTPEQKRYTEQVKKEIASDRAGSSGLTVKEMGKLSRDERADYVDAHRVKKNDPDYPKAQSAIRKLEAKARGE